jgi:hypothetical protein
MHFEILQNAGCIYSFKSQGEKVGSQGSEWSWKKLRCCISKGLYISLCAVWGNGLMCRRSAVVNKQGFRKLQIDQIHWPRAEVQI